LLRDTEKYIASNQNEFKRLFSLMRIKVEQMV
jgi:hypothetical protein